jgi:fructosamine-3-kinase
MSGATLEALSPAPDSVDFWAAAGRAVAGLHGRTSPRFGWDRDGWLGRLPQENTWDYDGHRFFATRRILRYQPVFIDPAVSWTWAEVDLSMAYCTGGIPEEFFAAYHEIHPPEPGWRERMELLNLRELLSVVAHFGPTGDYVSQIRGVITRFV